MNLLLRYQQSKDIFSADWLLIHDEAAYLGKSVIFKAHLLVIVGSVLVIAQLEVLLQLFLVPVHYILHGLVFIAFKSAFEFKPCVLDISGELLHIVKIQLCAAEFHCH